MSINRSKKRILADFKNYCKNKPELTWISVCNNNCQNVKVLIIGPENTPYQYGNFFVDLNFSNEYPFKPPKGKFKTTTQTTTIISLGFKLGSNLYSDIVVL